MTGYAGTTRTGVMGFQIAQTAVTRNQAVTDVSIVTLNRKPSLSVKPDCLPSISLAFQYVCIFKLPVRAKEITEMAIADYNFDNVTVAGSVIVFVYKSHII